MSNEGQYYLDTSPRGSGDIPKGLRSNTNPTPPIVTRMSVLTNFGLVIKTAILAHAHLTPKLEESMSSFYHDELQTALKEQTFGIRSFTITSANSRQAVAAVVLLEGQKLTVYLTSQGYFVDTDRAGAPSGLIHESLEGLLQSASPLYVKKRQEALFSALERIS